MPEQPIDLSSVRARLQRRGRRRLTAPVAPAWPAEAETEGEAASSPPTPLIRASEARSGGPVPGPAPRSRWTGWAALALTAAGSTLVGLAVLDRWRATTEPAPQRPAARPGTTTSRPAAGITTTARAGERVWPPEPSSPPNSVTFDGARYAVGAPGDVVEVGDWACTGRPTAVVLRPSTGEVVAFDGWPAPGEDAAARPVARLEGVSALRVSDLDGDGCDDLEAIGGDGRAVPVDTRALVEPP